MKADDGWHERMTRKCVCDHTRLLHGKTCEVPTCPCVAFTPKAAS